MVARAFDIAQRLEGLTRHASTHAAGIVIGDRPLSELVPLYRDPKSDMPVTQFNMKWVEPAGLVKFDFLGLKTLTVLDVAVKLLKQRNVDIDLATLPLDDAPSYQMLARGDVVGVFQVESQGMRRALVDMRPDRFEDIIALVALYRPGPMANIPTYCARKHGDEEPEYLHPMLEPILKETFGVIIYQEQVMQIAQVMAGYSLGDADLLRRAMGKKIRSEMEKQRAIFVAGSVKNGVPKGQADTIFELLAKFADYGFNKSHAAAYALVSYHTAYMKAHYPVEFLAASMTLELNNTDKLSEFRAEAQRLGIKVEAPNINRSGADLRSQRQHDLLRAGGAQGRRPAGGRADRGDAQKGPSPRWPISPRAPIRARSTSASSKAWPPPALSTRSIPIARGYLAAPRRSFQPASAAMRPPRSGRTTCSAAPPMRRPSCCRRSSPGCRPSGCGANTTPSVSSCPAIRSTITLPS